MGCRSINACRGACFVRMGKAIFAANVHRVGAARHRSRLTWVARHDSLLASCRALLDVVTVPGRVAHEGFVAPACGERSWFAGDLDARARRALETSGSVAERERAIRSNAISTKPLIARRACGCNQTNGENQRRAR